MSDAEKILVLFPGALGDFLCFLPTLKKLAARGSLDLMARTEYADLVPSTVRVRSLECHEVARLYAPGAEHEEGLGRFWGSYSQIYSWTGGGQIDFEGHLRAISKGKVEIFPFLPYGPQIHLVDYYLSCIGVKSAGRLHPTIRLRPGALAWSRRFWRRHKLKGAKVLALAPGSGARAKNWPITFYKTVADSWQREWGGKVIIILGPVEEERAEIDHLFQEAIMVRRLNLANLAAVIRHCDLYVGNDSGVTHLAAASGVEVIALFGPTDPAQWAPRGKGVTVVRQEVECSPCERTTMKVCPHRKCLTTLTPKDAIRAMGMAWQVSPGAPTSLTREGVRITFKTNSKRIFRV